MNVRVHGVVRGDPPIVKGGRPRRAVHGTLLLRAVPVLGEQYVAQDHEPLEGGQGDRNVHGRNV